MLGVIGASDKTPLTIGTGNREMHPVLISLANIEPGVRMKATSHSFVLAAYLPIPKFIDVTPAVQAALAARVYHSCLNIITESLQQAARHGAEMADPLGRTRICYTPLVSWIADLPEQRLIAGVLQNQSPVSEATSDQFGDGPGDPEWPHPRRDRNRTLQRITDAVTKTDPLDVPEFVKTCQEYGLIGVHQPFWRDWGNPEIGNGVLMACPSYFLTPDALHQWHKFFFDHPLKWAINIMTGNELDRRLAALQYRVGERHFKHGISKLKQVTGREHREIQKVFIAVIAGAVPDRVLRSMRGLLEFIFLAQSLLFYDEHLNSLKAAHEEFHVGKSSIYNAGGRQGKRGPINHWNIPKLELMNAVHQSIVWMGASYQWTSDITERCHITHVKIPYRLSNRRNFHEQCCRYMDRVEKCLVFKMYTTAKTSGAILANEIADEADDVAAHYPELTWLSELAAPEGNVGTAPAAPPSLFTKNRSHITDDQTTAFTVAIKPHFANVPVNLVANAFKVPDLNAALGDFFVLGQSYSYRRGQRKSRADCQLPFQHLHVWESFRMQQLSTQDSRITLPVRTVQALRPSDELPFGRGNTVMISSDDGDDSSGT